MKLSPGLSDHIIKQHTSRLDRSCISCAHLTFYLQHKIIIIIINFMSQLYQKRKAIYMCTSSDDDGDDGDFISAFNGRYVGPARIRVGLALMSIMELEGSEFLSIGLNLRRCNVKRDRSRIVEWSNSIDDEMFRRQFRLTRLDFFYVLIKIEIDLKKNAQQAINSSGSSILPYLIAYTLRILAGASYLDMIYYHVHVDSVATVI